MTSFDDAIKCATSQIEEHYFELPIAGGYPIFRERVYCYELYHKMRLTGIFDSRDFVLSGEVDKSGHPHLPGGQKRIPDFIVHSPGCMHNHVVIEVKSARVCDDRRMDDIDTAFSSLLFFINEFSYDRGIFLVFGKPKNDLRDFLNDCASNGVDVWHRKIDVWHHEEGTKSAILLTKGAEHSMEVHTA